METYKITNPDGSVYEIRQGEPPTTSERILGKADAIRANFAKFPRSLTPTQFATEPDTPAAPPRGSLPLAGEVLGSVLTPGPLKPFAAALGAGAGEAIEQYVAGKPFSMLDIAKEAGLSLLPEFAESALRATGRGILRSLPGGTKLRFEEAARQARAMVGNVFDPPGRAEVDTLFDAVRKSGVKVGTEDIKAFADALTPGKYADFLSEVKHLDRLNKTGGRYATLVEGIKGGSIIGFDIGELHNLQSLLRRRAEGLPFEAQSLLKDGQNAVDTAIDSGLVRGASASKAPEARKTLHDARKGYARLRAAEEMSQMVESKISSSPDLSMVSFQLRSFYDELRRGTSSISQQVNRSLDRTPGARKQFETDIDAISRQFAKIELPLADVTGFRRNAVVAGLGQMLSSLMLTPGGRQVFAQSVLHGRGTISPNLFGLAGSVGLKEFYGKWSGTEAVQGGSQPPSISLGRPPVP